MLINFPRFEPSAKSFASGLGFEPLSATPAAPVDLLQQYWPWLHRTYAAVQQGRALLKDVHRYWRDLFGDRLTQTMQGFALAKPYGYSGDFEIIDRIYTYWQSPDPDFIGWDTFAHEQDAIIAVRNRKEYFKLVVADALERQTGLKILNLGSGPSRDVLEFLEENPEKDVRFVCVDQDDRAIDYARRVCRGYESRIEFTRANVLRFRTEERFDLVWSAGLFDYLSDRLFIAVASRMMSLVAKGGQMIVGNFSTENSTQAYMELCGDWKLILRDPESLRRLLVRAGAHPRQIKVQSEPLGVNLFVHWNSQSC